MKILNLENEGHRELLQEIKNRVDKCKLCFQAKKKFRPLLQTLFPSKHVYTPFPVTGILSTILDKDTMLSEDRIYLCKTGLYNPISKKKSKAKTLLVLQVALKIRVCCF